MNQEASWKDEGTLETHLEGHMKIYHRRKKLFKKNIQRFVDEADNEVAGWQERTY